MEFLESSRSAKKFDPQRTARYRRADPRATNVVLGFGYNDWETTNKSVQNRTLRETIKLATQIKNDRSMTAARKRGILSSSVAFGNDKTMYCTESKNYSTHDLRVWGPRAVLQRDSYSWTDKDRVNLQALRLHGNAVSSVPTKFDPYQKLPPIAAHRNDTTAPDLRDDGRKLRSGYMMPETNGLLG